MVNQTGYGKRTLSTPTWPYTGITARQNIATSDLQRSMNDWTPHHPADVNHVSSETKRHQTETNRNTTNWNKNVITLVANGRTMIANGAVLCKTDAATHAWSGIIFPLSAILGQHVGSHNKIQPETEQEGTSPQRWVQICVQSSQQGQCPTTLQHANKQANKAIRRERIATPTLDKLNVIRSKDLQ